MNSKARLSRIVAALGAALAIHGGAALAAPCAGFGDVDDSSAFCTSIAWMKNRAITLGCGTGANYCPADFVRRDQMAAFMYRLGVQNAFLRGGNSFGGAADLGTLDNNNVQILVNTFPVATFHANGMYAGSWAQTGATPAIEGTTFSTSIEAVAVRGVVEQASPGGGSSGVAGINKGTNALGHGVYGEHKGGGHGVAGLSDSGSALYGFSTSGEGASGNSGTGPGVRGTSGTGPAVQAATIVGRAVDAISAGIGLGSPTGYFHNTDGSAGEPGGIALFAWNQSGDATIVARNAGAGDAIRVLNTAGNALVFRVSNAGTVRADGSYNCGLASGCFNAGLGADLAERIDATEAVQPGDVVEIDPAAPGRYRRSRGAASTLVAGVVSSRPAITMNNNDLAAGSDVRTDMRPLIALVGTVDVHASDENGAIRAGDLLVSASRPGTAMRGGRRAATGTVIGKALTPLAAGTGTVSMLVMLR
ncbi:MAG: hypothetical protein KJ018_08735 [Burkholderiales bacterium]|nr:hypothetical protein [Burkholderiales bacterium]